METRTPLVLSVILIAGMVAVSAWAWPQLPESARLAVHFDLHGNPNGFMTRSPALLILPAVATALMLVFALVAVLMRRGRANAVTAGYITGWLTSMVALFVGHALIVLKARGWHVDIGGSMNLVMALTFIALGNVLGKTRPNPLVGVRTFWTKNSDYSWDKTNRLAGRLMVAVGLATIGALAAAGTWASHIALFGGILALVAITVPLSYVYWRRDPGRRG